MAATVTLHNTIKEFPSELRTPMWHFAEVLEERFIIPHHDFVELKQTVERLAQAQERTEQRLDRLAKAQERLTAAEERTEQRLDQLAKAQEKTEHRLDQLAKAQEKLTAAQERTEQRLDRLTEAQEKTGQRLDQLAEAQKQTELQVQKLAMAQEKTEHAVQTLVETMGHLDKSISDRFAEMGSRWGIYTERTFRRTIRRIVRDLDDVTVKEGWYGDRQVDVVIRNGEHILLEITSRMRAKDIDTLYTSADDYRAKEGVEPTLMVATSYISPNLMQKLISLPRPIEIFSYEEEDEE